MDIQVRYRQKQIVFSFENFEQMILFFSKLWGISKEVKEQMIQAIQDDLRKDMDRIAKDALV